MKTYSIFKSSIGFTPVWKEGLPPYAGVPAIESDTVPTQEECEAAWDVFEPPAIPITPKIIPTISAWQARAAMKLTPYNDGTLLDAVEAVFTTLPDSENTIVVMTAWSHNANLERYSPTVLAFANALSLTSDEVDAVFKLAASLKV